MLCFEHALKNDPFRRNHSRHVVIIVAPGACAILGNQPTRASRANVTAASDGFDAR